MNSTPSFHQTKSAPGWPRGDGPDPAPGRALRGRSDDHAPHALGGVRDAERHAQRPFLADGDRDQLQAQHVHGRPRAVEEQATFLKGIKLNPALQNGALGGTVGSEHARGTGGMLTARPLKSGTQFKSFGNTTSGWGSGAVARSVPGRPPSSQHDLPEPAGRRARARHRGARADLVFGRGHADPAARGSQGRLRGAVRRASREDRSRGRSPVGAAQERLRLNNAETAPRQVPGWRRQTARSWTRT